MAYIVAVVDPRRVQGQPYALVAEGDDVFLCINRDAAPFEITPETFDYLVERIEPRLAS